MRELDKILIANRGEIALRVLRYELGIKVRGGAFHSGAAICMYA